MSNKWLPRLDPEEDELLGIEKVTALLLTMGKDKADSIIKQFDDREIRLVARAASALPPVTPSTIEHLTEVLSTQLVDTGVLVGSNGGAERLIAGVVSDEQVVEIMSELDGTSADLVWGKLKNVTDEKLAAFLQSEQPQVAAVVISKLDIDKASAVMAKLSSELRGEISIRLLALKPVGDTAVRIIAERLARELFGAVEETAALNKHARLGSILNKLEREQITEIIEGIERKDPKDARLLKEHVFSFEDIVGMSPEDRVKLFDPVQSDRVVTALRGAPAEVRDAALTALSPRSRRIVEAELATEVNLPRKVVMDARRAIAGLALGMAERSEIKLRPSAAPEVDEP